MPDETDNKSDIISNKVTNTRIKKQVLDTKPLPEQTIAKSEPENSTNKKSTKSLNENFELPQIPDYDRPDLEKYEKSEFNPSDFSRKLDIPAKSTFKIESDKKKSDSTENNVFDKSKSSKSIEETNTKKNEDRNVKKVQDKSNSVESSKNIPSDLSKIASDDKKVESSTTAPPRWKKYQDLDEEESFFSTSSPDTSSKTFNFPASDMLDISEFKDESSKEPESSQIEIKITEPEEIPKKSVTFDAGTKESTDDSPKRRKPRKTYDPLAWIPDEEISEETQAQIEADESRHNLPPIPDIPNKPKRKYDPLAYIPDKEDVPSENIVLEEDQVNKLKNRQFMFIIKISLLQESFKILK